MLGTTFDTMWSALGATVVHFLWQGAAIGLLTAAVLAALRGRSSSLRYAVACAALLLSFVAFAGTFVVLATAPSTSGLLSFPVPTAGLTEGATAELGSRPATSLIAAWSWALGALCMTLRCALSGLGAKRLRTVQVSAPDAVWQRAFTALKEELGVPQAVRLMKSGLAEVPMVVGWFSPVVLVPASAFTSLSPDQIKALVAHELAHIRRHDHWLNAAQAVIEIVLFFHPVVWWLSREMRIEREFCCDESSVEVTGNPRLLAEALAGMEALRITGPQAMAPASNATALASNGGSLMQRIQRILGVRLDGQRSRLGWHLPVGLALTGVLALAGTTYATPVFERGGEHAADENGERSEMARKRYETALARIEAAAKNGDMTGEEAKRAIATLQNRMDRQLRYDQADAGDRARRLDKEHAAAVAKYRDIEARLAEAVQAGKLTREEADKKLAAFRKSIGKGAQKAEMTRLEMYTKEIKAAVAAGKLTPEEGKQKLAQIQKRIAASETSAERFLDADSARRSSSSIEFEGLKRRLEAGVKSGRITPQEAEKKLAAWKQRTDQRQMAIDKEGAEVKRRIDAAVKAGEITPEQGKARFEAWRKVAHNKQARDAMRLTSEDVKAELQKLVEAGRITQQEADKKLAAYFKQLAEREKQLAEDEKRLRASETPGARR